MKLTDTFDARRLRPREPRRWRSRFGMFLALLLALIGILLTLAGVASLLGVGQLSDVMTPAPAVAITSLMLGLLFLWVGLLVRRLIRRRLYGPSGISLSPRLGRKR